MRYAIGIDFGTESGRAVLVDEASGAELATAVYEYANGVIDRQLPAPDDDIRLEPDWALQDPADHLATIRATVPQVLREAAVDPGDVVGLGIDATRPADIDRTLLEGDRVRHPGDHGVARVGGHPGRAGRRLRRGCPSGTS